MASGTVKRSVLVLVVVVVVLVDKEGAAESSGKSTCGGAAGDRLPACFTGSGISMPVYVREWENEAGLCGCAEEEESWSVSAAAACWGRSGKQNSSGNCWLEETVVDTIDMVL